MKKNVRRKNRSGRIRMLMIISIAAFLAFSGLIVLAKYYVTELIQDSLFMVFIIAGLGVALVSMIYVFILAMKLSKDSDKRDRDRDQFMVDVSYELREPLDAIISLNKEVSLSSCLYANANEIEDATRKIYKYGKKIHELTDTLIKAARSEKKDGYGKELFYDLKKTAEDAAQNVRFISKRDILIDYSISADYPAHIKGNAENMCHVMEQLLITGINCAPADAEKIQLRIECTSGDTGVKIKSYAVPMKKTGEELKLEHLHNVFGVSGKRSAGGSIDMYALGRYVSLVDGILIDGEDSNGEYKIVFEVEQKKLSSGREMFNKKKYKYSDVLERNDEEKNAFVIRKGKRMQRIVIGSMMAGAAAALLISITNNASWSKSEIENEASSYSRVAEIWYIQQKEYIESIADEMLSIVNTTNSFQDIKMVLTLSKNTYRSISNACYVNPDKMVSNNEITYNYISAGTDAAYSKEELEGMSWYSDAVTGKGSIYVSEPYYADENECYCMTLSKGIYDTLGNFCGVVAIEYYVEHIFDMVGGVYNEHMDIYLVEKDGKCRIQILSEDSSVLNPDSRDVTYDFHNLLGKSGVFSFVDYDGRLKIAVMSEIKEYEHSILAAMDWIYVYGSSIKVLFFFVIVFLLCTFVITKHINESVEWQQCMNDTIETRLQETVTMANVKAVFTANLAHEIRTYVNAVLGVNEVLLREYDEPGINEYANSIKHAGEALLMMVNDVLDLSKLESGKMEIVEGPFEVKEFFKEQIDIFRISAKEKGLNFKTDIDPALPKRVFGDDAHIKQVLSNLLSNAIKYTEKGTVCFTARCLKKNIDTADIEVRVSDTGIGISNEDMDKIFADYYRVRNGLKQNGTGLGLGISYKLLSLMGSELKVKSKLGQGSEFYFVLSLKIVDQTDIGVFDDSEDKTEQDYRKEDNEDDEEINEFTAPDAHILIVDDNPMNIKVFKGLMKYIKVNVIQASSGFECLKITKNEHADIIFMDIMMPDMDGIETMKAIKMDVQNKCHDTPIVAFTADTVSETAEKYKELGFSEYINKAVEARKIESLIYKLLPENMIVRGEGQSVEKERAHQRKKADNIKVDNRKPGKSEDIALLSRYNINYINGLGYISGDEEAYESVVRYFCRKSHEKQEQLEEFISSNDMNGYAIAVHSLKGDARTIGADDLADAAFIHEKKSKTGDISYVSENWKQLKDEWDNVIKGFETFLKHKAEENETPETCNCALDMFEVQEKATEIVYLLEQFETDKAMTMIEELLTHKLPDTACDKIAAAYEAIKDYDDDKAMEIIASFCM